MNPILAEIYSTIIPSAPFIIAAYALVWALLLVWFLMQQKKLSRAEQQLMLLEEELESLKANREG